MTDRAKTTRYASDDDADSLLADILDATEDRARAEQAELDKSLSAKQEREDRAKADAHAARLAQRQAKLEQEMERQDQLAKRRTQRMQALNPDPEPVAKDEPVPMESTPSLDEAAIRRQIAAEVREELRAIGMTPMPQPVTTPQRSRTGLFAAAAAVLIAGGLGATMFAVQSGYKPDPNPYAKAVFAPMDREVVALEMGSVPIPKEPVVIVEDTPAKAKTVRANPRTTTKDVKPKTSVFGKPSGKSDAASSYDRLKGLLDSSADPFSAEQ